MRKQNCFVILLSLILAAQLGASAAGAVDRCSAVHLLIINLGSTENVDANDFARWLYRKRGEREYTRYHLAELVAFAIEHPQDPFNGSEIQINRSLWIEVYEHLSALDTLALGQTPQADGRWFNPAIFTRTVAVEPILMKALESILGNYSPGNPMVVWEQDK
ncbi:MAG: hypothetical protein C5B49_13765 [Bdellovibrio sp.]|nr:MAG: hypothetical protein C5B49_13765 [Bdellovibrio sp.]